MLSYEIGKKDNKDTDDSIDPVAEVEVNPEEEEAEMRAKEGAQGGEENMGPMVSLLIDARNGFNELNWYGMLWTHRYRWARGSRFLFKCYHHCFIFLARK